MRSALVSLVVFSLTAGAAAAQNAARAVPPPPRFPANEGSIERARQTTFLDQQTAARARREQRERERVSTERAGRLAALVNAGQCHEAHRTALAENDATMARRIATVCSGGE
jgi:hypothetical protein